MFQELSGFLSGVSQQLALYGHVQDWNTLGLLCEPFTEHRNPEPMVVSTVSPLLLSGRTPCGFSSVGHTQGPLLLARGCIPQPGLGRLAMADHMAFSVCCSGHQLHVPKDEGFRLLKLKSLILMTESNLTLSLLHNLL